MSIWEKFISVIKSRRFWVAVATVALALISLWNAFATLWGLPAMEEIDPEIIADTILPVASAVALVLSTIIPLLVGNKLIETYTSRPAGVDDNGCPTFTGFAEAIKKEE